MPGNCLLQKVHKSTMCTTSKITFCPFLKSIKKQELLSLAIMKSELFLQCLHKVYLIFNLRHYLAREGERVLVMHTCKGGQIVASQLEMFNEMK